MSDEIRDPNEDLADMDLDNIKMGLSEDDLDDVVDSVRGDRFQYSGIQCRVRKTEIEGVEDDPITMSQNHFWVAGVQVDWPDDVMLRAPQMFDSGVYSADEETGWIEVRVGHEHTVSREEVIDEAEWLAEQVVMLQNDPNSPV